MNGNRNNNKEKPRMKKKTNQDIYNLNLTQQYIAYGIYKEFYEPQKKEPKKKEKENGCNRCNIF